MKPRTSLISIVFLAMAAFVVPAQAETLGGTFDGIATLTPTGTQGVFIQSFTGDGEDATFGDFIATGQSTIDFSNPPDLLLSGGAITETFANGTLFGTTTGTGAGNGHGGGTFSIEFVINGGTGDFVGDTGEVTLTGTITVTSPTTEAITGSFSGSVATAAPEPSTWMLLVTGLATVWRLRRP